jgi:hypothetical protein
MKFNLNEQFLPRDRAILFLQKYPLYYIKDVINGNIEKSRKANETDICNYWNEVVIEIKKLIK